MDGILLAAASHSTSCGKADEYINKSEDVGPNGFDPRKSADAYAVAGNEYETCSKAASSAEDKAKFLTLAVMANDQAMVRYLDAKETALGSGAAVTAMGDYAKLNKMPSLDATTSQWRAALKPLIVQDATLIR